MRMMEAGWRQESVVWSARREIARAVGSTNQSVVVALYRVMMRHEEAVLMRWVRRSQRRRMLEHLVVKSTVDDSVSHAEDVTFSQRLCITKTI